jgi:hypothetical protein
MSDAPADREGLEDPRPAAVTFITTQHFTLQGARAATIAASTGGASIFLGALRWTDRSAFWPERPI